MSNNQKCVLYFFFLLLHRSGTTTWPHKMDIRKLSVKSLNLKKGQALCWPRDVSPWTQDIPMCAPPYTSLLLPGCFHFYLQHILCMQVTTPPWLLFLNYFGMDSVHYYCHDCHSHDCHSNDCRSHDCHSHECHSHECLVRFCLEAPQGNHWL